MTNYQWQMAAAAATKAIAEITAEIELIPHHTSINQFVSFWLKMEKTRKKNVARIYFGIIFYIIHCEWFATMKW